jgi:hypothetical protein
LRFWDASALVPLCVQEDATAQVRALVAHDPVMTVWLLSRTEIYSAFCRRVREGSLTEAGRRAATAKRDAWLDAAVVVRDALAVASRGERLLRLHVLRAADALQLAAALLVCEPAVEAHDFVTFDGRLAVAAGKEGFSVPLTPITPSG